VTESLYFANGMGVQAVRFSRALWGGIGADSHAWRHAPREAGGAKAKALAVQARAAGLQEGVQVYTFSRFSGLGCGRVEMKHKRYLR